MDYKLNNYSRLLILLNVCFLVLFVYFAPRDSGVTFYIHKINYQIATFDSKLIIVWNDRKEKHKAEIYSNLNKYYKFKLFPRLNYHARNGFLGQDNLVEIPLYFIFGILILGSYIIYLRCSSKKEVRLHGQLLP